jgi:LysM repeat protein
MAKKIKITATNSSTMYDLAKVFGTTIDDLKKYNNLDSNIIKSGQEFYYETDDVEGVKKRLSDLQKYREFKQEKAAREKAAKEKAIRDAKKVEKDKEDYGDLTPHQIRDYLNFKKLGLGNSVQDFKNYKAQQHKSN